MAQFLSTSDLNREIKTLFSEAQQSLLIVSPYIKLHEVLKRILEQKKSNPEFLVRVVFGKNENNIGKSLQSGDLEFFKGFPNVEIYYNANLHAKYYANESKSIVTSMNLYDYSMMNNIESGVLFEQRFWGFDNQNDDASYGYFENVIETSEEILVKHPKEQKHFFGLFTSYGESVVEIDKSHKVHTHNRAAVAKNQQQGYCIRTGKPIPFNMRQPFSENAYKSWSQFSNENYPEKFCHFSGEPSNGETSMMRPVLRKHYSAAKAFEKQ